MADSTSDIASAEISADGLQPSTARLRLVALVAAAVLVLDQATKIWAVAALDDRIIDLFWTARFRLIYNTGSAFSLGEGFGRWLGIVIAFVVVGVLWYARSLPDRRARILLGLIVGGAIGNLIDRLFRADDGFLSGGVVDFIDFQWWPVFNVADIGVVCGAIGLALLSLVQPEAAGGVPDASDDHPASESGVDQDLDAGSDPDSDAEADSDAGADSDSEAEVETDADTADR